MVLEKIHEEWSRDADVDFSRPDVVNRNIPLLHAKYWRMFTDERQRYLLIKQEYDELCHAKTEWFLGRMDDAERVKRGWPPQPIRIVRQELDRHLMADPDLVPLQGRLQVQELKLKLIEDIIKSINGRGFLIKNHIDWLKFSNGA